MRRRPWLAAPVVGAVLLAGLGPGGPATASASATAVAGQVGLADEADPVAAAVLVPIRIPAQGAEPGADPSVKPADPSAAPADPSAAVGEVGAAVDPQRLTAAVAPLLTGGALGSGRTPARVVDVATGDVLMEAADRPTAPASTLKLVTAVSVLDSLGPDALLRTRTLLALEPAPPKDAPGPRRAPLVVLVGGGDPSLSSTGERVGGAGTRLRPASTEDLAEATAAALRRRGIEQVRLGYDASLFTGPAVHPSWADEFPAIGVVAPVSALQVDQGRSTPAGVSRVADPAARAARVLAGQLEDAGVDVAGAPDPTSAPADGAPLAEVASPAVGDLVERMLATSDNDYAEALARLGALAAGYPGSFAGDAKAAGAVLDSLGIAREGDVVVDGSGLSRRNALTPGTLTDLLRIVASDSAPPFGAVAPGLPVAGATGSLRLRFTPDAQRPARGVVRAKTGTLTGVASLAGYASRPDGRLLAFAFLDDQTAGATLASRTALDRAASALVTCDCADR